MNIIRKPFRYSSFNAVYWLIGINLLVFIATQFRAGYILVYYLSMIPIIVVENKWVWTFISYMFMHGSVSHILFNMFGLFIFGTHVERQMGSWEFLLYYFITGTLAGIFSFFVYYYTGNYIIALMGASGALFAVMLAYAVFFPTSIVYVFGILPLRAPVMVLGYTVIELISSIAANTNIYQNTAVAHLTHLAGFAFGWLYFMIRFGINPWRRLTMK